MCNSEIIVVIIPAENNHLFMEKNKQKGLFIYKKAPFCL